MRRRRRRRRKKKKEEEIKLIYKTSVHLHGSIKYNAIANNLMYKRNKQIKCKERQSIPEGGKKGSTPIFAPVIRKNS